MPESYQYWEMRGGGEGDTRNYQFTSLFKKLIDNIT